MIAPPIREATWAKGGHSPAVLRMAVQTRLNVIHYGKN